MYEHNYDWNFNIHFNWQYCILESSSLVFAISIIIGIVIGVRNKRYFTGTKDSYTANRETSNTSGPFYEEIELDNNKTRSINISENIAYGQNHK